MNKLWSRLVGLMVYRIIFRSFGRKSFIISPIQVLNPHYITIGHNVRVRHHLRMEAIDLCRTPDLRIGDNCNIEQGVHIICSSSVVIGRDCSITARCAIFDTSHPFTHIGALSKIGNELNADPAFVRIGDGSFLGIGCVIQPNVCLGRRCVVGANSVVLAGNYPDGAVLAGAPARVLRVVPPDQY